VSGESGFEDAIGPDSMDAGDPDVGEVGTIDVPEERSGLHFGDGAMADRPPPPNTDDAGNGLPFFAEFDGNPSNGCEADIRTDGRCGSCAPSTCTSGCNCLTPSFCLCR
jgi:hypothetical protein